jgi:Protein of unknown function (DUF2934)
MASDKLMKFHRRIGQLALMTDTMKVREILGKEYGIHLSLHEIRMLRGYAPKIFTFRVIELWVAKQPQEALAWAASISWPQSIGVDLLQLFIEAARKTLPNLNRDMLDEMLPEGPGKAKALDLAEAATDPYSLANRILAVTHPTERALRLRALAQGWPHHETAAEWARQNLSGADKAVFYSQVGYWLAEQNPQAALEVLAELKGEIDKMTELVETDPQAALKVLAEMKGHIIDVKSYGIDPQSALRIWVELVGGGAYASTLGAMMNGLVQTNGYGQQVAELVANSDLNARQRSRLISELARRWVRQDADAAIAWANALTAPEDVRAAIPLLVSQLNNDRAIRAVEAYLKNPDPVMELALIEAAAPPGLGFDPRKSRLILDPIISNSLGLKLQSSEAGGNDGQSDLREMIARRAYEIYEERGRRDGDDLNDWLRAEAEVIFSVMVERGRAVEGIEMTREEVLWKSVTLIAKRLAEVGLPSAAMEWLDTLPFASQKDYAEVAGVVLTVWTLKSPTEAAEWLQNSALDPTLKSDLQEIMQPTCG